MSSTPHENRTFRRQLVFIPGEPDAAELREVVFRSSLCANPANALT
jgi:hypothetical protein